MHLVKCHEMKLNIRHVGPLQHGGKSVYHCGGRHTTLLVSVSIAFSVREELSAVNSRRRSALAVVQLFVCGNGVYSRREVAPAL
jgi:hypothetical protein